MEAFEKELEALINRHSIENEADMPDFLLAKMICDMVRAMGPSIKRTLDWYGVDSVCHPKHPTEPCKTCGGKKKVFPGLDPTGWYEPNEEELIPCPTCQNTPPCPTCGGHAGIGAVWWCWNCMKAPAEITHLATGLHCNKCKRKLEYRPCPTCQKKGERHEQPHP